MLPSSAQARNKSNIAKFADTAVVKLVNDMVDIGALRANIVAKLAGGAQMFAFKDAPEMLRIGLRNVMAAKEVLNLLGIPVIAEDTGSDYGRTIEINSENGKLLIKTIGHGIKEI
jgi:chemotaxis protein CheD